MFPVISTSDLEAGIQYHSEDRPHVSSSFSKCLEYELYVVLKKLNVI